MRRARWIAVFVATAAVAACSGGAGEVTTTRATVPPTTTTTTTTIDAEPPPTSATETPSPAETTVVENPVVAEDPVPASASRPGPARTTRSRPAKPEPTGHIDIPAIGLSHATYEGIDLATINHGPSHWPDTALPGELGNTVFPGHRTTYSRPFWDIDELVPGDEVIFTTPAGRFTYHVTETFVVGERDTWIVEPTEHATFTIFACHPKGSARQRYVAKGELVSPPATTTTTTSTTTTTAPEEERSGIGGWLPG